LFLWSPENGGAGVRSGKVRRRGQKISRQVSKPLSSASSKRAYIRMKWDKRRLVIPSNTLFTAQKLLWEWVITIVKKRESGGKIKSR